MMRKIVLTSIAIVVILTFFVEVGLAEPAKSKKKAGGKNIPVSNATAEADQQMTDFSLAGYGEKGAKSWDLSGENADIFDNVVRLSNVTGNLYGDEQIKLTADKGDFDKIEGKVHLEDNVIIATSAGTKMTTDSLDWDRKNEVVSTDDPVNISRNNMITTAMGVVGQPSLNKVTLGKDVEVNILPSPEGSSSPGIKDKIVITCDGPLEIDYQNNVAVFKNNVKVDAEDRQIYSDIMEVYFISGQHEQAPAADAAANPMAGSRIDRIVSRGNVKIVSGENVSYSDEAVYTAVNKKIVLSGKPRLVIQATGEGNAPFGN
ncbi:MAG: LPS export ABC transporter periplasmic protein LptC [Candidatus Omnitrophica bacterium]|nr:LPS export ABC transporter periplasmic protein LptC [Candidatus Omnitrophota bacterium]